MIVVFGGAGFVGSHVVQHYSSRGERVRVVDNRSRAQLLDQGDASLTNWEWVATLPNVEMLEISITSDSELREIVSGANRVFHAAAQTAVTVSVTDPRQDFLVNAAGTINVLEAVRLAAPDAALVFCSTNKVYGANVNDLPQLRIGERYVLGEGWDSGVPETLSIDRCEHSPYGASKTAADLYVQEYGFMYGLRTCVLRMSCIYGPRQWGVSDQGWIAWFARAVLEGIPITIYGDGYQTRDLLEVRDLVSVVDAAFEQARPADVYNIGGGPEYATSLREALTLLEEITGRPAEVNYSAWRPSDQKVYVSDISKAQRQLGWRPTITPRQGLETLVDWLREPDPVITPSLEKGGRGSLAETEG